MQHDTGLFTGLHDTTIFTQHWLPDGGAPRAVVVLVHGLGEHSGRYEHVAAHLTGHGCAVYALDHRGHGQSGGERLGIDPLDDLATDLGTFVDQVRAQHPDLPLFIYGHSMGTLITLLCAFNRQDDLAGLVLSGTALQLCVAVPGITGVVREIVRLSHQIGIAAPTVRLASKLMPGARVVPSLTTGISRDPDVRAAARADPLNFQGRVKLGVVGALQRGADDVITGLPTLRLLVLALHGTADSLALVGGVALLREKATLADVTVKTYDGLYHEVHNEPEQDAVLADVAAWLDARLAT